MKKTYQVILFILITLIAFSSFFIANTFIKNKILYKNTISISILHDKNFSNSLSIEQQIKKLEEVSKYNKVELTKIIWNSADELSLYTNDFSLNNWLDTSDYDMKTKKYLSNDEKEKVRFDWIDNREEVKIFMLNGLENVGISGEYFIRIQPETNLNFFSDQLNSEIGLKLLVNDYNALSEFQILKALFSEPILLIAIGILFLILVCSLLFLYIQLSRKIALQVLSGYSYLNVTHDLFNISFRTILMSLLISIVLSMLYMKAVLRSFAIFSNFIFIYIVGVALITISLLIISIFWIWRFWKKNNIYEYLKNKKKFEPLIIMSKVFQLLFLTLLPIVFINSKSIINDLNDFEKANTNWSQTQNIYTTSVQYISDSYMERRPYEQKLKKFYIENYNDLTLIDASNYEKLSNGTPLYVANTDSSINELISPYGRSIYVNLPYLKWNPILDMAGQKINKKDIHFKENSLNLLVPKKLEKYVNDIKEHYTEEFIFRTYEISHDIYEENSKKQLPEINIIIVQNNQNYFTYASNNLGDKNNIVIDPIAVVDTGNLDASQYLAWLSTSIFFEKKKDKTGIETILPLVTKSNVNELIQIVTPIYDQRAKEIDTNNKKLQLYYFFSVLIIISFLLCTYYFSCALYEKNIKKILLKIYSGYSRLEIYMPLYILWGIIDVLTFVLASFFSNFSSGLTFSIYIIFSQILIIYLLYNLEENNDYFNRRI